MLLTNRNISIAIVILLIITIILFTLILFRLTSGKKKVNKHKPKPKPKPKSIKPNRSLEKILSSAKGRDANELKEEIEKIKNKYGINKIELNGPEIFELTADYREDRIRIFHNEKYIVDRVKRG